MSTKRTEDEQRASIQSILEKQLPFNEGDLEVLRKNTDAAGLLSGKSDYFVFRMQIEHIDSILKLNKTSTRLTTVGICVAVVGVCLALLQAGVAVANLLRH